MSDFPCKRLKIELNMSQTNLKATWASTIQNFSYLPNPIITYNLSLLYFCVPITIIYHFILWDWNASNCPPYMTIVKYNETVARLDHISKRNGGQYDTASTSTLDREMAPSQREGLVPKTRRHLMESD